MRTDIPTRHRDMAHSLESEGIVQLIEIRIPGTPEVYIRINNKRQITWQSKTWEQWAFSLTDIGIIADGEMKRPKFTVANPDGLFSSYIGRGMMDAATITLYEVLTRDITTNTNSFIKYVWRVGRVVNLNKVTATFELRSALDGHNFTLPARKYIPPEYPHVSFS